MIGNGYHNEQKERQAIEQLIRHRCAALVVHAKMIPDADLASLMKQMPGMVLINRILPGFENRCIALDDRYGAWLATRHLIQQGHTRIGYLCSNHSISDAEDRLQGYYDALAESGIPANDRLVTFGEPDESGGEQAMTEQEIARYYEQNKNNFMTPEQFRVSWVSRCVKRQANDHILPARSEEHTSELQSQR